MNYLDAKQIVLNEGTAEDGLLVLVRMGEVPSSDRMTRVCDALESVYRELNHQPQIDRALANALFGLSFHVQGEIDAWLTKGIDIPDNFLSNELVRMFLIIESIFENEWLLD